jgi:hypothetical protein
MKYKILFRNGSFYLITKFSKQIISCLEAQIISDENIN